MSTSSNSYQDDLAYLVNYAREDWVGLSVIVAVAGTVAGRGATFDAMILAMLSIIDDLIDRGAVPGNLTEQDPGFEPWPGSKEQVLSRIAAETHVLGRLPVTGEICWIHGPSS
jgi:hypothetical protein